MNRLVEPLVRAVTYTRWAHLLAGSLVVFACGAVYPGTGELSARRALLWFLVPLPLLLAAGLVAPVRRAEGLQARLMLFPGAQDPGGDRGPTVSAAPSVSWRDRGRTALWLVVRAEAGFLVALLTVQLMALALELAGAAAGSPGGTASLVSVPEPHPAYALLVPVPVIVLVHSVALTGAILARAAQRLLGPSPGERIAALEQRTELLLERHRMARELHDSMGHALTLAVVQAGAARTAGDAAFTARALAAIEDSARVALDDLDRVLGLLREDSASSPAGPGLAEAHRLLGSARATGAQVSARLDGDLQGVPGAVSREAYRMLQEALTNVVRHAGGVPVRVGVRATGGILELEVCNALAGAAATSTASPGGGSGLRGLRERAELLGGTAEFGARGDEWQLRVALPLR